MLRVCREAAQPISAHRHAVNGIRRRSSGERLSTILSRDSSVSDRRSIGPTDSAEMSAFMQVGERDDWHVDGAEGTTGADASDRSVDSVRNVRSAK